MTKLMEKTFGRRDAQIIERSMHKQFLKYLEQRDRSQRGVEIEPGRRSCLPGDIIHATNVRNYNTPGEEAKRFDYESERRGDGVRMNFENPGFVERFAPYIGAGLGMLFTTTLGLGMLFTTTLGLIDENGFATDPAKVGIVTMLAGFLGGTLGFLYKDSRKEQREEMKRILNKKRAY